MCNVPLFLHIQSDAHLACPNRFVGATVLWGGGGGSVSIYPLFFSKNRLINVKVAQATKGNSLDLEFDIFWKGFKHFLLNHCVKLQRDKLTEGNPHTDMKSLDFESQIKSFE